MTETFVDPSGCSCGTSKVRVLSFHTAVTIEPPSFTVTSFDSGAEGIRIVTASPRCADLWSMATTGLSAAFAAGCAAPPAGFS